jgi:hypothetical protein
MSEYYIVIDFEGFKLPNHGFIIIEFAYVDVQSNESMCYYFKSPSIHAFKESEIKVCTWLTKHIDKINWNIGEIDFKDFTNIINYLTSRENTTFLIKGKEKTDFINQLTQRHVINIESFGCPKFQNLQYPRQLCGHTLHQNSHHCALKKAIAFTYWFRNERPSQEKLQLSNVVGQM